MNKTTNSDYISREEVKEMIDDALRRHNRRSTIISSVLGWILIGGYSFGLFFMGFSPSWMMVQQHGMLFKAEG